MSDVAGDPRVEVFRQLNALKAAGTKVTEAQRRALINQVFPSAARLAYADDLRPGWTDVLARDDEHALLGPIFFDIFKHDQATPGRSGPKPGELDIKRAYELLRRFSGQDFSSLPFAETFVLLIAGRSLRSVAAKTGLSKDKVWRLSRGDREATRDEMEQIAAGFRKHPSYFREYRADHLVGELRKHLDGLPEASVDFYRQSVKASS